MFAPYLSASGPAHSSDSERAPKNTTSTTCSRPSSLCTINPVSTPLTAGPTHSRRVNSTRGAVSTSTVIATPLLQMRLDTKVLRRTQVLRSLPTNLAAAGRSGLCVLPRGP